MNPCKNNKKICEKSTFSFPSNQMSTKRLQAQMIRTHTKATYNNSRITTIYSNILNMDFETNRNMVIQYKYPCYMRYYKNLLEGNISQPTRLKLSQMLSAILESLSKEEYNEAFQIEPVVPPLPKMTTDSGLTFYVVNRITSVRNYFVFKNLQPDFLVKLYTFYTFDLSDPSNLNTKLSFSEESNSGKPYRGIYYISTPGTPGAKMILNLYNDIKTLQLYTFNDMPMYTPLKYNWGYSIDSLFTYLYKGKPAKSYYIYLYARQFSYLSIYEAEGAKFSINDTIEPVVFIKTNPYRYYFTYGVYYLEIQEYYAATLLNKGYEDCVAFVGDTDKKKIGNVNGLSLVTGTPKEGEYTFYYGRVKMIVYKPFPYPMTIYARDFGIMGGEGLFHFTNEPKENPSTDVINLNQDSVNSLRMTTLLRFNEDTSNNTKRKYGINHGDYSIYIPSELPVAFMNSDKEDLFIVIPDPTAIITGPFTAPDGKPYLFYTGGVTIQIKDNYGKISMCTRNGYSGGYQIFVYNPYFAPPIPSFYKSKQGVSALRVQTNMSIKTNLTTNEKEIHFNDETSTKYGLYKGVYMIFNIPRSCPITLLNRGKEALVTLEALFPNHTFEGAGPDGTAYTFYYGILKITVHGDFGFMSLYTLYNNYMGGYKMFSYDSFFDNRDSYPDPLSVPVISSVVSNNTFTETKKSNFLLHSLSSFSSDLTIEYGNIWDQSYTENTIYVGQRVSFNPDSTLYVRYNVQNRIYVISSVNQYITLLNKNKDYLITLRGNISRKAIASDGNEYTFYSGSMIALYVFGDFDVMTLEILGGPVGRALLIYSEAL